MNRHRAFVCALIFTAGCGKTAPKTSLPATQAAAASVTRAASVSAAGGATAAPADRGGHLLKIGDRVMVEAIVTGFGPPDALINVHLETVWPYPNAAADKATIILHQSQLRTLEP